MNAVYDFSWKGSSAFNAHGIDVLEICSTVISERRDHAEAVAGRSGLVHSQDGAVEEVEETITIQLPYDQGRTVSPVNQIRAWLKGYGRLDLSTIPGRYMMAYITDMISLDPIVQGFNDLKGRVIFRCMPYLYHTTSNDISLTSPNVITNPGTCESQPIITVTGTGDVDLMIGNQIILLTDLDGSIIINSVIEEAYTESNGIRTNMNNHMAGDFPLIQPGTVAVSWDPGESSSVSGIVIRPNWRDEM